MHVYVAHVSQCSCRLEENAGCLGQESQEVVSHLRRVLGIQDLHNSSKGLKCCHLFSLCAVFEWCCLSNTETTLSSGDVIWLILVVVMGLIKADLSEGIVQMYKHTINYQDNSTLSWKRQIEYRTKIAELGTQRSGSECQPEDMATPLILLEIQGVIWKWWQLVLWNCYTWSCFANCAVCQSQVMSIHGTPENHTLSTFYNQHRFGSSRIQSEMK